MLIFHQAAALKNYLDLQKNQHRIVGFTPTMGALHEGHISLIRASRSISSITLASIFVNPTQFNDPKDFENYPVTIQSDLKLLEASGCDILYLPSVTNIYNNGMNKLPFYELGFLETVLEGKYRPGHFQGVCQVMDRLLSIVQPDHLFMGQKDYQQCMVVQELIRIKGWKQSIVFHTCPTLREKDGLAMSSRNLRLTESERAKAVAIYQELKQMKEQLKPGSVLPLKVAASGHLKKKGFQVEYTEIADAETLESIDYWEGERQLVGLVAAFNGPVRLIDNLLLT